MGSDYAIFIPTIDKILKHKFTNEAYKNLVDKLIRNDMRIDYIIHSMDQEYRNNKVQSPLNQGASPANQGIFARGVKLINMKSNKSQSQLPQVNGQDSDSKYDDPTGYGGYGGHGINGITVMDMVI